MTGYDSENQIEHRNRNKKDNRWKNLRHKTQSCNIKNIDVKVNNTTGVVGVSWNKNRNKWEAFITNNKKRKFLGYFNNFDEAVLKRYNEEIIQKYNLCNSFSSAKLYLIKNNII
jgi:hypothetical protein